MYLGKLTKADRVEELIELGRLLRGRVRVELAGRADKAIRPMLLRAHDEGSIVWHGELPAQRLGELAADALTVLSSSRGVAPRNPRAAADTILALRERAHTAAPGTSAPAYRSTLR